MNLTGKLDINVVIEDQQIKKTEIKLSRPDVAQKMLVGQSVENTLKRIEQMFVVCKQAQKTAAMLALHPDQNKQQEIVQQQSNKVRLESIEQYFWRLLFDLPKEIGIEVETRSFVQLYQLIAKHLNKGSKNSLDKDNLHLIKQQAEQVFFDLCRLNCDDFLSLSAAEFQQWQQTSNAPIVGFLQALDKVSSKPVPMVILSSEPSVQQLERLLKALLTTDYFCQSPTIDRQVAETGAIGNRQRHSSLNSFINKSLAGRLMAKLICLAQLISELTTKVKTVDCGAFNQDEYQLSWVNTARGLLLHLANIQEKKVHQYYICAPTEWNFHPQGILTHILNDCAVNSPEDAIKKAKLAALILDPCIDFNVGASHA